MDPHPIIVRILYSYYRAGVLLRDTGGLGFRVQGLRGFGGSFLEGAIGICRLIGFRV